MTVSVVVPALDEETRVGRALASVAEADEVIVVDGGSRDRTAAVAAAHGAQVLDARGGRGPQMRRGAEAARGDVVLFLHADTRLEAGWRAALVVSSASWGAFRFAVDSDRRAFRVLERAVALRVRLFALPYGDQALFARRDVYARAGGMPALPLMEDVALVRRLRREGPPALLAPRAFTSPRRWEDRGVLATGLRNLALVTLYAAGMPPDRLARLYYGRPS